MTGLLPPEPVAGIDALEWLLDPDVDFLNHGSFGSRPRAILELQDEYRHRFEAAPILTLDRRRRDDIQQSLATVARFVGSDAEHVGFVTNTTEGINGILRSMSFEAGDELLTTTHVYNAVRQTMKLIAREAHATYIEVDVQLPLTDAAMIHDAVVGAITANTKLVLIDHITSPTAVIFPVDSIIAACRDRGIPIIVDGAHGPGMVELDTAAMNPTFYVANLHKWTCAPIGAAFVRVSPDWTGAIHPATISHFLDEGFQAEFEWQGTRDISPWIVAGPTIGYLESTLGWANIREHNHQLVTWAHALVCDTLGSPPATPLDGHLFGSIASIEVPDRWKQRFDDAPAMQAALFDDHRIEVPVMEWDERWWIRPSAQVFNRPEQYERLAAALRALVD